MFEFINSHLQPAWFIYMAAVLLIYAPVRKLLGPFTFITFIILSLVMSFIISTILY